MSLHAAGAPAPPVSRSRTRFLIGVESAVRSGRGFIKIVQDRGGELNDDRAVNSGMLDVGQKLAHYRLCQRRSVAQSGLSVLEAIVQAKEEFIARKRLKLLFILKPQGLTGVNSFNCAKNCAAVEALAPAPHLIGLLLEPGVGDFCLVTAINTNHVNILTLR